MVFSRPGEAAANEASTAASSAAIEACRARAGLFSLLGRCLEAEVDRDLLDLFRSSLAACLREAGVHLGSDFARAPAEHLLHDLAEEFTGLFVAPGAVAPYASVFETGCMFQEPCTRALRAYREAGWDYQRRHSGEFADHVGTMLAFVGRLAEAEAQALERGAGDEAAAWRERRERFVLDQLGPWAPGWCRRARIHARHDFYRAALDLAERVLWDELEALADRRELKELVRLNQREPVRLDYDADFRKASGL